MKKATPFALALFALPAFAQEGKPVVENSFKPAARRPNIVVILGDDIGYGDFGCYGATKVRTPNIDKLASQGMRFTNGYATAATCTPTRYALLTGRYAWRQAQPSTSILSGIDPLNIPEDKPTIASLAKQAGYSTACVGKWHLGLGRQKPTDYNKKIDAGPNTIGFDYSFIIPATGDRVPCVYLENHEVVNYDPADPIQINYGKNTVGAPTWKTHPQLVRPDHRDPEQEIRGGAVVNGICRIGFMTGGTAALWQDDSIADTITNKATTFIKQNREKPFLLYFATHDVHAPIAPNPRFLGTSQCGRRGDTIQQFDACVGEVMKTLEEQGLAENTLVLVSSDNGGCGVYQEEEKRYGYRENGPLRGYKVSPYEGGVREPFIVRWPGQVKAGTTCDQVVGLVDCLATIAAVTGQSLPPDAGPDSFNFLPVLRDPSKPVRDHIITQSGVASNPKCAREIRVGQWKLIPNDKQEKPELYDLVADLGETTNVAAQHPEIVAQLAKRLEEATQAGRTR